MEELEGTHPEHKYKLSEMNPENVQTRDDHGAGVPEWTPAGVCILGWSRNRNQYFRLKPEKEPESTLRSVQELTKIFKKPIKIFVTMLAVVKQYGINSDVFSN